MKWSLEVKIMAGGLLISLVLMGIFRFISYQNAIHVIESSNQIEQSESVLNHLIEIWASITDTEAGRQTYLLLGHESELQRHYQAKLHLQQHLKQLQQQLAAKPNRRQYLVKLQSLVAQRTRLDSQSIKLYQADKSAIDEQIILIKQLNQNRNAIRSLLANIQTQEEQVLQTWLAESSTNTRHHIIIELLGTILIFIVLLGLYALIYQQMVKRQKAEANQQMLVQEKEISELKLRFFSMVSHEFRTPLSIILGSAQLLAESSQSWSEEKKHKNLDRIQSSARSMNQLLTDILTLTRAEAGKLEFHPTRIDLEAFCLNLIEDIKFCGKSQRDIKFTSQGCCSHAFLDEKLLHSILSNLLSNALKYSPPETPIYLRLDNQPNTVTFQVSDAGIGIPLENQANLYEPFYRAQNVGRTVGVGLGLAVVKKCVDLHQGEICVDSQVGIGTTFTVKIPKNYHFQSPL